MGNPFHRGPYAFGDVAGPGPNPAPVGATIGRVYYQDGSGLFKVPDYETLTIENINGSLVTGSGQALTVTDPYELVWLQASAFVTNSYGEYVVFGYSWNGGEVQELGRVQVNSNDPVFTVTEKEIENTEAGTLRMHIATTFEWAGFTWEDAVLLCAGV